MSSNSISPVASESNSSSSLLNISLTTTTPCDDRTCSTAKCALCLHCSQQYCFVHFLKHNEQLSLNAYNFTLTLDQLGKVEYYFELFQVSLFFFLCV